MVRLGQPNDNGVEILISMSGKPTIKRQKQQTKGRDWNRKIIGSGLDSYILDIRFMDGSDSPNTGCLKVLSVSISRAPLLCTIYFPSPEILFSAIASIMARALNFLGTISCKRNESTEQFQTRLITSQHEQYSSSTVFTSHKHDWWYLFIPALYGVSFRGHCKLDNLRVQ